MKKKKNFIIVLLVIVFVIICYFVDKTYLYFKYNISIEKTNFNNIVNSLKFNDTLTININSNYEDYIVFNNIKTKNTFNNFTKTEETDNLIRFKENDNSNVSFITRIDDTHLNLILNDESMKVSKNELKEFFDKNNITNDIQLFEFFSKVKYTKNNIFTSKDNMKKNYITNYIISIAMTSGKSITKINGDYNGYIFNLQNGKEVSIIKNDKRYIFTFIGKEYFTDENIKDFVNSIVINEEIKNEELISSTNLIITEQNNCNLKLNEFYKYEDITIYTSCIDEIHIKRDDNKKMTLKYHLENVNQTFETSINKIIKDATIHQTLKDGGTTIYKKDNYTIIKCNTIDGNKDIYIGNKDFNYEQGYCK